MKWLTLEDIKDQLRLEPEFTLEDRKLTRLGNSSEQTVLNVINRTYDELVEQGGEVPAPIVQASLMLCDIGYKYGTPVTPENLSMVPYTFDLLIKPYMKL